MSANPKKRRPKSRQKRTRSQPEHKAKLPQLVVSASGKLVPAHMVTPENVTYKGKQFLRVKSAK